MAAAGQRRRRRGRRWRWRRCRTSCCWRSCAGCRRAISSGSPSAAACLRAWPRRTSCGRGSPAHTGAAAGARSRHRERAGQAALTHCAACASATPGGRYHLLPNYNPAAARASCQEAAGWRELYLHNDDAVSYEHVAMAVALALELPVPLSMALCYHAHTVGQVAVLAAYVIRGTAARRARLWH